MKKTLLILSAFLSSLHVFAQAPNWLWANSISGSGMELSFGVAIDGSGNTYASGHFTSNSVTIGSTILTNAGGFDGLIVKYDPAGNVLWAKNFGGVSNDYSNRVAADAQGNCYVTGHFESPSLTFGNITINNTAGGADVFVVKYDAAGNVAWAKSGGGTGGEYTTGVAVDGLGNCYVTGWFSAGNISFDNITLTNTAISNFFLVKYSSSGVAQWGKTIVGTGNSTGWGVAADASGNSYITGTYSLAPATFGSTVLTPNATGNDFFVAKYDPSGNALWAKSAVGAGNDEGRHAAVDASGNVYVTGRFDGSSIDFGNLALTNAGGTDAFLVKYDVTGNLQWSKRAGGALNDYGYSVGVDGAGNSYLGGAYASSSITFGTITLTNPGLNDLFVVKHDPAGNALWMKQTGGSGIQSIGAIAVDAAGSCYISGAFSGNNPLVLGSSSLTNAGNDDIYIARLASCAAAPAQPGSITGNANPCFGSTQAYSIAPVTSASSYTWTLPSGWTGTSNTNSISALVGSGGGTISVVAENACGTSAAVSITASAASFPSPTIINSGAVLTVTAFFASYQWYLNGNLIAGATNQSHTATQSGNYYVVVTNTANCSGQSNTVNLTATDIDDVEQNTTMLVYPNPVKDVLYIKTSNTSINTSMVQLYDCAGKLLLEQAISVNETAIPVNHLPAGMYMLRIGAKWKKIVKQ